MAIHRGAPLRHDGCRLRCQWGTATPLPMTGVLRCGVAWEYGRQSGLRCRVVALLGATKVERCVRPADPRWRPDAPAPAPPPEAGPADCARSPAHTPKAGRACARSLNAGLARHSRRP
jgi:hypothetical protein